MKFRALLIAFALAGSVACSGGEKKADEGPVEDTVAPIEEPVEDTPEPVEEPAEEPAEDGDGE